MGLQCLCTEAVLKETRFVQTVMFLTDDSCQGRSLTVIFVLEECNKIE